ncbi:DHH family phosphoesterase [Natranaeroarchaeum sulfidigenes]|uniref:Archaea-specific RecJ-like exonuclease, containsDnaJ-type Zn finger domain n=1 Tax=Natranaeroarchaeum sulfidigenes TaxID=2784880 RepID=A0A897MS75_9EURY|nr:OB-fold nucleic acid binding domain-containing protein [Natranaeroarchaeum sulfidigenes]QSG03141.1 Archaea-specific RecJ-like exonuclease, containsDnaJ-type Zn finger domain [Natranaeroarchaeum sulfidigenes]
MTDDEPTSTGDMESPVVYDLDPECTLDEVTEDGLYLATVNGVVEYGVFVDLSEFVSGLVHESKLDGEYEIGDQLVVDLEDVRENGDVSFRSVDIENYELESVAHEYDITPVDKLEDAVGSTVYLAGQVVQIKQTGGPTLFHVRDESGIVPCAIFESAGVRAYPEISVEDYVRVSGTPEHREGAIQIEADSLTALDDEEATEIEARLDAAVEERAAPADVDPLIEWEAFEKLRPDIESVAKLLRRTVLEGRPIRIRHHADGDGMCASIPVELALERFIEGVHEDPEAKRHLFKRLPSKAPFYEMEDATRDLNFALEDRERHGQKLPLLLMLDNGSTEEDTPAYETLRHYDIPIVVLDHHHPDPEAVEPLLTEHVNPYLYDEDYRITTGMMCVELARMIDPEMTDELRHVPAVAGISDRSAADAMDDYLELASEVGYDPDELEDVGEALDYAAHWLRYDSGRHLVNDALNVGCEDEERHHELVDFLAEKSRNEIDDQLEAALPHVEHERLDNGAHLYRVDVENDTHRFTYPAPGKTTGAIHDHKVEETGDPVITIGYGPDFSVLRSDGVRLDIPRMVTELDEEIVGGGVSGGGHLVVGSIKFVKGRREEVLDALVEKMAEAEIDEALSSTKSSV